MKRLKDLENKLNKGQVGFTSLILVAAAPSTRCLSLFSVIGYMKRTSGPGVGCTGQLGRPSPRPPRPPVLAGIGCQPGLLVPATVVHWGSWSRSARQDL